MASCSCGAKSAPVYTPRENTRTEHNSLSLIIVTTFEMKRRARSNHRPHPHSGTFLNVARFGVEQCAVQNTAHPSENLLDTSLSTIYTVYTLVYVHIWKREVRKQYKAPGGILLHRVVCAQLPHDHVDDVEQDAEVYLHNMRTRAHCNVLAWERSEAGGAQWAMVLSCIEVEWTEF